MELWSIQMLIYEEASDMMTIAVGDNCSKLLAVANAGDQKGAKICALGAPFDPSTSSGSNPELSRMGSTPAALQGGVDRGLFSFWILNSSLFIAAERPVPSGRFELPTCGLGNRRSIHTELRGRDNCKLGIENGEFGTGRGYSRSGMLSYHHKIRKCARGCKKAAG